MPALTTSPWKAAVDRTSTKTVVGSRLRSAEWAQMPIALREGAFFSAGVENVRVLSVMREKLTTAAKQIRTDGLLQNRARFVADMRNLLGAAPGDSGRLTDLTSVKRLELIWNFQQADAHGFAARKADLDPDVMDAYPAYRLVRLESRRVPREWMTLWGIAGAKVNWVGASRTEMVALKTSPIWIEISRFRRPWPPFDYGSGMGLEDVDRDETEQLELLPKGEAPAARLQRLRESAAAQRQEWNDNLQASVKGISPEGRAWMKQAFGPQISIEGDRVKWVKARSAATITPPIAPPPTPSTPAVVLPDVDRVAEAAAKASSVQEAHAIVALPEPQRGTLRLVATEGAQAQAEAAHAFLRSVVHKDVAPAATVKVELFLGRCFYDPSIATAFVRRGDIRVTVHEIAHHLEITNPRIFADCVAYRNSRARPGETAKPLSKLTGNPWFSPREIAIEDEWAKRGGSVYSGKVYSESLRATEVLTVGLERLYLDPVNFARQDPDYFKFILRVLRPTP